MDFDRMLRYCAALELHNDRAWFHTPENYALYTAAKQDFIALADEVKYRIAELVTPDLAEKMIFSDTKKLLYRIPRDMRGRRDVPPFNPRFSADLSGDRHSQLPIGYYLHIQPGDRSLVGFGTWAPDAETLQNVRAYISEHFDAFSDALAQAQCDFWGNKLKNVPRGFDADDPAAEYLKYKDWFAARPFRDGELQDFDSFIPQVLEAVQRMEPLRRFFAVALTQTRRRPWVAEDWL